MLNIVVPMAGHGRRFSEAGYTMPKPLIPVIGRPMIQLVSANLQPSRPHRFIYLCLQEHIERYQLDRFLKRARPNCLIVAIHGVTEGAACTVLAARALIDNDDPLMIANCDQWIGASMDDYLAAWDSARTDAFIMTMTASHPKWSYVRLDKRGTIVEVVEKKVVSTEATVGIYNFRKGSQFVAAATHMIAKNIRVQNEFYVAPTYNELIAERATLGFHNIGAEGHGMYGLGVPEDLAKFEDWVKSGRINLPIAA